MKHCRTPTDSARVWLTTILDLQQETTALVAQRQTVPGPDVEARVAAHMALRKRLGARIGALPKRHKAAIKKALLKAGIAV